MYEYLKKLFGEPKEGEEAPAMTYAQLEAAIDADKDISLVNLKAGGYVSQEKLNAKITELNGVKQQLEDANAEIQSYKDMDIEGIKQAATDWETKYNADTKALQDQLAAQTKAHAEDMLLSGYKFSSVAAKNGILAEVRAKDFKIDDNGTVLGGKEFIEGLMANDDYKGAFVIEQPKDPDPEPPKPKFTNTDPAGSGAGGNGGKKMTLAEAMKYKNEHPDVDVMTLIG